ncbi:ATP-grasp domain-containing protein (plasmid) [Vibrio tubiashii]|uniref:ATP-grasp domain-containing protein n=1 Tax=Vibrio tubiashii TaxID=29498 RepID=UPI00234EDBE5|nr:ATP-grasp domain-containing protein [Vibrio tubiashii]WCP70346.1 ATP-grasp domain-containing protein [Vibrio tubiashii]
MKHVLLVGGSRHLAPVLKKLGCQITLLIPTNKLKRALEVDVYDKVIALPKETDYDHWLTIVSSLHQLNPIESIAFFNEPMEPLAAFIAEKLALPGHTRQVIELTHDKKKMRAYLAEKGLDDTPSRLIPVSDMSGAEEFCRQTGYPVIVKPLNGRGSMAVSKVLGANELASAIEKVNQSGSDTVLMERFLEGNEWSVECFSEHGQHKLIAITEKFKDLNNIETGHCLPAELSSEKEAEIKAFVFQCLDAIGLKNGPSHTELFTTPEGPRIVETHARLAGDRIPDLVKYLTDVDLEALWVEQTCGKEVLSRVPELRSSSHQTCASIRYYTPVIEAIFNQVKGVETIEQDEHVKHVEVLQTPGFKFGGIQDSFDRGASVVAVGKTCRDAVDKAQKSLDSLVWEFES